MVSAEQPVEFVGWWEIVFYTRGGQTENIEDVIEHIQADGRFEAYSNGALIGAGRHVDFQTNPAGFTNIQEDLQSRAVIGRELVIYRLTGDTLEVCKAPEQYGRPVQFGSSEGTPVVHAAAKRIADTDPRITKPV
jgi:uncharacterized protein (TIGR03067 family)